jgi:hypothetical protein
MEHPSNHQGPTRLPWTDIDMRLVRELRREMPYVCVGEFARQYNERNPQRQRTVNALRAKLRNIGQLEGRLDTISKIRRADEGRGPRSPSYWTGLTTEN